MERMKNMFMGGQGKGKERERDGKDKENTTCSPDMNGTAGCCPEMMEQYFNTMRNCFEEMRKEEEDRKEKKPERAKCC